ncbi:MFS transporter [Sphingobium lignivorans]|uniref:MFS family permease n=1 Tax=Sphingobium lignivorans TaxID=2735886 RepID=A0ABR6NBK6_9SPHN|nr:MFS transporter [Sphingobium lignivorans]MBB5984629.1 MFS family permease [Sphingobium lignivorans]
MAQASLPSSPLRLPLFRAVWMASLASNFGGLVQSVGASWTMASMGASAEMVALVQSSVSLPIVLLSLWAGAVADNLDRRKVMLCAQSFMLVASVILALAAWAGLLTPWALLGFTFLIGCGTAVNGPAWQASVGEMVPRPMLPEAVALNSMGFNIARSLGPAIGGAIVAVAGAAAAFATNAVSYVGLILVLARWKPDRPPRTLPRESLGLAMLAGVRYVSLSPAIRIVLVRAIIFGVPGAAIPAMMPLVARDLIAGGPLTYGILLGAFGIGAVGGALASRRLRSRFSTEMIVRLASLAVATGACLTAFLGYLLPTLVALALAGGGWVLALSTFNVSVQMASPRWVVARALALYQMAAFGGLAAGSWLFGVLADHHGVAAALAIASVVQLLGLALAFLMPLPAIEDLDLAPADGWREPETALRIEPRSGPIVVTIEYRVAEENVPRFLAAMDERKRIRRRDGASHWTLLRDLAEPQLWVERYHVATWLDYVRHNRRRTKADQANTEELRSLRIEGTEPVVHRRIERQTSSLPRSRAPDAGELDPMTDPSRFS